MISFPTIAFSNVEADVKMIISITVSKNCLVGLKVNANVIERLFINQGASHITTQFISRIISPRVYATYLDEIFKTIFTKGMRKITISTPDKIKLYGRSFKTGTIVFCTGLKELNDEDCIMTIVIYTYFPT